MGSANRMTGLILAAKKCSQCLCSPQRIVSKDRAAQIIRDCRKSGTHFVCHKSPDGEVVHCRGVHDLHESTAYQIAKRLGIPIVEKDMDQ
jgi:hypothetical protein